MKASATSSVDAHAITCELVNGILSSSGSLRLRVTGRSMLPTLWPGDLLEIQRTVDADVREGDIVTFSSGRRFVAHRVVTKAVGSDAQVHTQGDAERFPDSPVSGRDLLGKVSLILRNGRRIAPQRNLRFSERAVASLFRRSDLAGRVAVGVHGIRQLSRTANAASDRKSHA